MKTPKQDIRVLLVEDYPPFRGLLSMTLGLLGYSQIKEAVDGPQALKLAQTYQPHLVLMDTRMPGPYGYEICRQMRQEDYGKIAAIGGMSNSDNPEYLNLWIKNGADFYFGKSLIGSKEGQNDLDARIQEALAKHQQG